MVLRFSLSFPDPCGLGVKLSKQTLQQLSCNTGFVFFAAFFIPFYYLSIVNLHFGRKFVHIANCKFME